MDAGVIGRDEELAVARAFLAGMRAGPRALLVEGEAGIGKTAVWLAALDEAAARGCRVLRCAGEESEARLSFVGLADLIGDTAGERLHALPAPQRQALEVALLRTAGEGRGPEPPAVAMALRSLLVALARLGARPRGGRRRAVARRRHRARARLRRAATRRPSRRRARDGGAPLRSPTCWGSSARWAASGSRACGSAR